MDPHSIVIVSLHSPKEKIWGELLAVSTAGVTMRVMGKKSVGTHHSGRTDRLYSING